MIAPDWRQVRLAFAPLLPPKAVLDCLKAQRWSLDALRVTFLLFQSDATVQHAEDAILCACDKSLVSHIGLY
jgi:hypothetical protein